jgi:hypothetical protein
MRYCSFTLDLVGTDTTGAEMYRFDKCVLRICALFTSLLIYDHMPVHPDD